MSFDTSHAAAAAFLTLWPNAKDPKVELPHAGHAVAVLDLDNFQLVHVACYSAEHGNFVSDGGWFELDEVHAWAYIPNSKQSMERRSCAIDDSKIMEIKMKTIHYRDSHLKEAIEFAALQDRAVIVCDYVDSLTQASQRLAPTAPVVVLKAPYNARIIREALEKFEALDKGYLAVTKGLMLAGGFRFTRDASIACAGPLTEMASQQLVHRFQLQNPCTHFMKVRP